MLDVAWTTPLKDLVTAAALVIGGFWAMYRFGIARDHASHLHLTWSAEFHAAGAGLTSTIVTLRLENRGKTLLSAKPPSKDALGNRTWTFEDDKDKLRFACGAQFRHLPAAPKVGHLSWYTLQDVAGVGEINLLEEFETESTGTIDFHLEPGEVNEITVPINLLPGSYLVKVHFVGASGRMDYWSKLCWLKVQ